MHSIDLPAVVVANARLFIDTPYIHQHAVLGRGVDCVGLIIETGRRAGVLELTDEGWAPFAGYSRTPNPHKMAQAIETFLRPIMIPPQPPILPPDGSVCWMGWRAHLPMHLAILATAADGRRTMIHAHSEVGRCVEHGFAGEWPGRVISWWSYPGLEEA